MHTNNISKRRFITCENELKYLPSYPELQNASKISKEKNSNLTELQFSRKFSLWFLATTVGKDRNCLQLFRFYKSADWHLILALIDSRWRNRFSKFTLRSNDTFFSCERKSGSYLV